ncbi:hypothetical protein Lal_00021406 [Lupinus albus]|nr:hypothetical protein Lal_00021406 [Lupinus albus]
MRGSNHSRARGLRRESCIFEDVVNSNLGSTQDVVSVASPSCISHESVEVGELRQKIAAIRTETHQLRKKIQALKAQQDTLVQVVLQLLPPNVMEEELNVNNETLEGLDDCNGSEEENVNEIEGLDFEEIDFRLLNEDEVKKYRFLNNEIAYKFYKMYGMKKGFGIRKYHTRRDKDDGCSIFDYSIFGDVLAFDATYGRNKYKFPVVIFSGVNHHKQTTMFADAVVSNETEETYVWLLEKFLEAMNGKHPKCVITDGDLSMKNAIRRFFPEVHHRLCAWHICNNAGKNIKKNNFHKDFQKVMYADVESGDFNMMWEELINKHGLHNNAWVAQIFDCRSMWARSYIRGKFYAGLHTTSRCEGLHSQMGRYIESGYNVTEFLHHFQRCLSHMRNNDVMEDFKSSYGDELLQTPYHNLEGYAASIYTRVVFKEFREVLLEAAKLRIISTQQTSSHVIYKIGKHYSPNKKWHVSHFDNGTNMDIKCSCKRMESFGMPRSHSVFVLLILDISQLSSCLVLDRWTKKAKDVQRLNFQQCDLSKESVGSSRYGALSDGCRVLCNFACKTEENFTEMLEKIYNECSRLRLKQQSSETENVENVTEEQVRDPIRVRAKGRAPGMTTKGKRGNQCGICREIGHNRANCPNVVGSCSRIFDDE